MSSKNHQTLLLGKLVLAILFGSFIPNPVATQSGKIELKLPQIATYVDDFYPPVLQDNGREHTSQSRKATVNFKKGARYEQHHGPAYGQPGHVFKDCESCPEMVIIPAGKFKMGALNNGMICDFDECPPHTVNISNSFAVGRYEITFAQWDFCVATGVCRRGRSDDQSWGRGNRPAIYISWHDAQVYASWLSRKTGKHYRLLTEAEWEYAARAGTTTRYCWGNTFDPKSASIGKKTQPVGTKLPNDFGLFDVHGNVWEWVEDCWHDSYKGAPSDGSAWTIGGDCLRRVLRGGSWINSPSYLRSAVRGRSWSEYRDNSAGFRIAMTLLHASSKK